jgi:hypothetical protein
METCMAHAVLLALIKEKDKVQELTHGRSYSIQDAPLADATGRLPGGKVVQSGGPLDRLHHVEVTVHRMTNILDSITNHLQTEPTARHLFIDDEDSLLDSDEELPTGTTEIQHHTDNDVTMALVHLTYSSVKRQHRSARTFTLATKNHPETHPGNPPSLHHTPPPKRKRPDSKPSANPDGKARERGET